jgi:hypothetical protein
MGNFSRRDLFRSTGALALLSATGCNYVSDFFSRSDPKKVTIISGYRTGEPHASKECGLSLISESSRQRIKLDNEIHSVIYSDSLKLWVFTSKLDLYSYVRYGSGDLIRLKAEDGNYFYGHAQIDEKRQRIYFSQARITESRDEFHRRDEPGFIYAYALPDLRLVEKFTSYGSDPHDLKILGDSLIVCNGGADSNVTLIDLDSKKLLKDFKVNVDYLSLRHIEQVDGETFNVIPLSRDKNKACPPYKLSFKDGLSVFPIPYMLEMTMLRLQILSGVNHDGYFYGTCPAMDSLAVWDQKGKFIGGIEVPSASNLAYSESLGGVVVGSGVLNEPARLVQVIDNKVSFTKIPWAYEVMGAHSLILES